ncbi:hypothetical protein MMYC01_205030 [Madurella mycetomatis]|uniref:F-box domain-containing protein n=1 Tax=Madurella mycetomatis TaxID=100816 RepID=A0A175W2C4_9PEZI|nr:hypothetical protein MMYC01_205030 [Madurella mycetomatis]
MRDITELPHDIFLLVISHLSPRTCVRCRSVSRRWQDAFTSEVASLLLLRWNFPRCREMRLAAAAAASLSSSSSSPLPPTELLANLRTELRDLAEKPRPWSAVLADVARRYYYLNRARPRVVEKYDMAESNPQEGSGFSFWGVAPWNRFLRFNDKTSDFHYPDPAWWYSQEDGLLVYPAAVPDAAPAHHDGHVYRIVDLFTGQSFPVPFDVRSKHIRRARLAQGVLIFEWAEALPYHQLNDREVVHRHFVTALDVIRQPSATWKIEFRSEWKLHFLGLPLNRSDRFFSAHTATHYAAYFWQPNRSLYHIEPIEQLAVWDISSPSPYRPSKDPKGDKRPAATRAPSLPAGLWNGNNNASAAKIYGLAESGAALESPKRAPPASVAAGPRVVRRMAWRELDFYGVRQRATPQLRSLALDDQNLYVVEEEHRWADGQHSSLIPPRVHLVRCTGIPILPMPTSPESSPQASYPAAARSTGSLGISLLVDPTPITMDTASDGPVHGPVWVDTCGADGDVNMNFCRRVADANRPPAASPVIPNMPPLLTDNLNAETRARLADQFRVQPSTAAMRWSWELAESERRDAVLGAGSARWAGLAPCWRHEDFPYLTVTEMVDFAAGVRVTARHCFMLEAMSVHIRPAVSVEGTSAPPDQDNGAGTGKTRATRRRRSSGKAESARCKEVHFPDDMWSELMAKGHIAGDERWIVGEDDEGRVSVVRF